MSSDPPGDVPERRASGGDDPADWTILEVPVDGPPPSPILPEATTPGADGSAEPSGRTGPPGGRVFTLEGRPAPGLYFIAWFLTLAGAALFFVATLAQAGPMSVVLAVGAFAVFGLGLAAGAGYQVLARRDRHPAAYRGPSPALVFGIALALSTVASGAVFVLRLGDPQEPFGFLVGLAAVAVAYVAAVWLFVVRTGALRWRDIAWPAGRRTSPMIVLADIGFTVAMMLPATLVLLFLTGIVASIVGVQAPDVLPSPRTSIEAIAVLLAAAFVAPVGEELFFRGFSMTAWLRDLGPRSALIRSASFFAIVHVANVTATNFREGALQALLQFIVILPLGFVLGWLFLQRGIVAAVAGHVTYNGLLLVLLYLATQLGPALQP